MEFMKFYILTGDPDNQAELEEQLIIFNSAHIVSIKPIKMMLGHTVVNGFWIRTSNGKKYRATQIPEHFKKLIADSPSKRNFSLAQSEDILASESYQ